MSASGRVYYDVDGDDVYTPGTDIPLQDVKVEITEVDFVNGYDGIGFTDATGTYNFSTAGMVSGPNRYLQTVWLSDEWDCADFPGNTRTFLFGTVVFADFPQTYRCHRIATSRWVTKVCYIPGQGVRITFKDHKGTPTFSCFYPGTTKADYLAIVAAASKGEWVHDFYDKKRSYVPWPILP